MLLAGKGHLACVSFAGGKAFSRRRNLASSDDDRVKTDVTLLSHYEKMREAAKSPQVDVQGTEVISLQRRQSLVSKYYAQKQYN